LLAHDFTAVENYKFVVISMSSVYKWFAFVHLFRMKTLLHPQCKSRHLLYLMFID